MGYIVELSVDWKLLLDILGDGIEYACRRGYWGQIEQYKWYWWYVCDENGEPNTDQISPDLTGDTVLCRIRDDEDGEADYEDRQFVDITLNKMEKMFFNTLLTHPHLLSILETDNGVVTDANYDADSADVILQKIVLGEVVYG